MYMYVNVNTYVCVYIAAYCGPSLSYGMYRIYSSVCVCV